MAKFKLKNYTTIIRAEKTIMEIEQLLFNFGSTAIMKEYLSDGRVASLSFKIGDKGYKLPANIDGVKKVLYKSTTYRTDGEAGRDKNSYNVAWRVIKDWIHSQLSVIWSGQAEPEQVLLPYLYDGNRTLYDIYKAGELDKQLEYSPQEVEDNDLFNNNV